MKASQQEGNDVLAEPSAGAGAGSLRDPLLPENNPDVVGLVPGTRALRPQFPAENSGFQNGPAPEVLPSPLKAGFIGKFADLLFTGKGQGRGLRLAFFLVRSDSRLLLIR